ncbi:hypothetical protein FRC01_011725, partial [Tulasnella sp. 417]
VSTSQLPLKAFPWWDPFKALTKAASRLATGLFISLAVAPAAIIVFLVSRNVLTSASDNLSPELPHPVVERRILRASRSRALPPVQAVRDMIPFMFSIPHTRVAYIDFFRHDGRVPFTLAPSLGTRAWIAGILPRRWETAEVVTTPLRPTGLLQTGLVSRGLITFPQPVATRESGSQVDTPSRYLPLKEDDSSATKSSEAPPTAQAPPPTNAAVVPTSTGPATALSPAVPLFLPSTAATPSQQKRSTVALNVNPGDIDASAKGAAPAPIPTNQSRLGDREEIVTTFSTTTDSPEPTLVQDRPPPLVEPVTKDTADESLLSFTFGERTRRETRLTESSPTVQAPPPTKSPLAPTSPINRSVATTLPVSSLSMAIAGPLRPSRKLDFKSHSSFFDDQTNRSAAAPDLTATTQLGVTLATPLSGR